ncbi:hypothetical protein KSS87_017485 [Heliosperma pusillum]|nr:hypothetical protein KSS87_017485 [Heliosperma pusillum]
MLGSLVLVIWIYDDDGGDADCVSFIMKKFSKIPCCKVADVKRNIESVQGGGTFPAASQMLIHQGKVLKDNTTLEENKVAENSFVVIMLAKSKSSSGEGSAAAAATASKAPSASATRSVEVTTAPPAAVTNVASSPASMPGSAPLPASVPAASPALGSGDVYDQAASNLVAGSGLEQTVQQILDMGGGTWDRDTVIRALRAAFNNPERAVEYLYSGIPEQPVVPPPTQSGGAAQPVVPQQPTQPAAVPSSGPNANPLNLFPQGIPNLGADGAAAGALDFLRGSEQFQALRAMVQANPQILQPMLQELGKQNPHLMRLIQENQNDFLQLMNEPVEGEEGNILGQLGGEMPQAIEVTPEEREAIERLEAMGFDRATVLQVYFACNKDEELAANYLLDHMHELQD